MQIRLTSTGARSGQPRTATLYAWPDGDDRLVLVGSSGGSARHPAWVHNLRAHPDAVVERGRTPIPMRASEVPDGRERDRLWQLVVDAFPLYARYQQRTERRIPLFVLESMAPA
jgi:F420H(2)-dependent quinone reductase